MTPDTGKCIVNLCAVGETLVKMLGQLGAHLSYDDLAKLRSAGGTLAETKDMAMTPVALEQEGGRTQEEDQQ